jgi:PiT family inorganic phosphate transporter
METVQTALWVVVLLVVLALLFDFMNGFHDAANSIATVVSTGVLKPGQAVLFAAFFNLVAIFGLSPECGRHGGQGHCAARGGGHPCGLWCLGGGHHLERAHLVLRHSQQFLPRADRRHCGRGDRQGGRQRAGAAGILKTVAFIFVSPLLGFVLGSLMMVLVAWLFRRSHAVQRVDKWFRRLQLVSAGAYSLGHGGNDAQKTIGIIWMLLIATAIPRLPTSRRPAGSS